MTELLIAVIAGFALTNITLLFTRGRKGDTGAVGPMGMDGERGVGCDCC